MRPSIRTSSLFAVEMLKPRALMAQARAVDARDLQAVGKPQRLGQARHAGAADVFPRMTDMAAATSASRSTRRASGGHVELRQLFDGEPFEVLRELASPASCALADQLAAIASAKARPTATNRQNINPPGQSKTWVAPLRRPVAVASRGLAAAARGSEAGTGIPDTAGTIEGRRRPRRGRRRCRAPSSSNPDSIALALVTGGDSGVHERDQDAAAKTRLGPQPRPSIG